jgi:hypothetical protein
MNASAEVIPERSYLDQRIQRSYSRMLAAQTDAWRHAWCDGFLASVSARNAVRSVAEVRQIERARGLR